ncbi:hypothetical protein OIDMADRAFT_53304 [Oidiodendron maius Zn]|uniref:Uncharacterized protein n=1 Tax=Oidiodendron maius (strain Zn) TaxID=913774 RepID=A0A0C3CRZ7_OIDMZ|nr:hypothetical protein OIDMADRAFT_53304 [Oidiodendron maius Zn]
MRLLDCVKSPLSLGTRATQQVDDLDSERPFMGVSMAAGTRWEGHVIQQSQLLLRGRKHHYNNRLDGGRVQLKYYHQIDPTAAVI